MTTQEERDRRKEERRDKLPKPEPISLVGLAALYVLPLLALEAIVWSSRYFRFSSTRTIDPYLRDTEVVAIVYTLFFVVALVLVYRSRRKP